jgi:hypothetical protein
MSTVLLTLGIAFIIVMFAMSLLGISWLLTGKSRIQPGACGKDPTKKKTDSCGTSAHCQLCDKHPDKEKKE